MTTRSPGMTSLLMPPPFGSSTWRFWTLDLHFVDRNSRDLAECSMSITEVIEATKSAVAADPKNAHAVFRSSHDLVGLTETTTLVGSGHTFTVDEPDSLG